MRHDTRPVALLLGALLLGLSACSPPAEYVYGVPLKDLRFQTYGPDTGIHPDTTVLEDPNNPFAASTPGPDARWELQAEAGPVAAYYGWATVLAREPGGEAQFYVATNLVNVYQQGAASQADLDRVRTLAVRAFQAVLDHFPDAVTYDATGKIPYELVTPSYRGIVELGGSVQGGWVMVRTASGAERAVRP